MVFTVESCVRFGVDPYRVKCEVDLSNQLPKVQIVGLPSQVTQESLERIRAAIVNSGLEWPAKKIVINLLPADLPKWGSHFELPMALAILVAGFEKTFLNSTVFSAGELSLSGSVQSAKWISSAADWFFKELESDLSPIEKKQILVLPKADAQIFREKLSNLNEKGKLKNRVQIIESPNILDAQEKLVAQLVQNEYEEIVLREKSLSEIDTKTPIDPFALLKEVSDEPMGVSAALISLLGNYHVLFAGAHGMGKSMLVRAMKQIAKKPNSDELSELLAVKTFFTDNDWSKDEQTSKNGKPYVYLQTSITRAALEGSMLSNGQILAGELTRAHCGYLIIDEFLEQRRDVLEALRQPLDEGCVRLQRARFRVHLPARFQLLATTNLCPCGAFGSYAEACRCAVSAKSKYLQKLSGPLLDRFDLVVWVGQSRYEKIKRKSLLKKSLLTPEVLRMADHFANPSNWELFFERLGEGREIEDDEESVHMWANISTRSSDRGKIKMARVSKTIAKMLGEKRQVKHLLFAQALREELPRLFLPSPHFSIPQKDLYSSPHPTETLVL